MKFSAIEEMFRKHAKIVGSVFLLKPQDAIELVEACRSAHIAVFGAEGFYILGKKIQPSMEHSISRSPPRKDGHDATIAFLRTHLNSELWFEVMVDVARK